MSSSIQIQNPNHNINYSNQVEFGNFDGSSNHYNDSSYINNSNDQLLTFEDELNKLNNSNKNNNCNINLLYLLENNWDKLLNEHKSKLNQNNFNSFDKVLEYLNKKINDYNNSLKPFNSIIMETPLNLNSTPSPKRFLSNNNFSLNNSPFTRLQVNSPIIQDSFR
ncbi:uncharacterized protein ASCRUDRAFT_74015 [Ascoidea rubescens DSM 1968]|uniref:Uncharacterized protein n=1 Tax=Ascoidea rubescens DSM 1968 TaxID=1344418 RepID=A0A1D2VS29_9ASCO|nr:hypothetical protein ASCRUDRAFT_74015 [Ascoidea rubescens DSM 1968]ODV64377.1 hypothetical protein ASCRUDRAFT_74015 [Ascoidea rubescens DSM 1968]